MNEITTLDELRSAISLTNANLLKMSNTNNLDEVAACFLEAKDHLIAIYRYNISRLS